MPIIDNELIARFSYHPPKENQPEKYKLIRNEALKFARMICDLTPDSREQSLALIHLEDVVYCANAAIARRE